jgi:hypothetical protein
MVLGVHNDWTGEEGEPVGIGDFGTSVRGQCTSTAGTTVPVNSEQHATEFDSLNPI